jgi:hypothetical protein
MKVGKFAKEEFLQKSQQRNSQNQNENHGSMSAWKAERLKKKPCQV